MVQQLCDEAQAVTKSQVGLLHLKNLPAFVYMMQVHLARDNLQIKLDTSESLKPHETHASQRSAKLHKVTAQHETTSKPHSGAKPHWREAHRATAADSLDSVSDR
jgi:hypothetical protein